MLSKIFEFVKESPVLAIAGAVVACAVYTTIRFARQVKLGWRREWCRVLAHLSRTGNMPQPDAWL